MRKQSATKENITPSITCSAPWRLTKVIPLENYRLEVEFIDGTHGFIDMKKRIIGYKAGVFADLRDLNVFNQVYLHYGAVTWPGELDLAPDAMHTEIKKKGHWILD